MEGIWNLVSLRIAVLSFFSSRASSRFRSDHEPTAPGGAVLSPLPGARAPRVGRRGPAAAGSPGVPPPRRRRDQTPAPTVTGTPPRGDADAPARGGGSRRHDRQPSQRRVVLMTRGPVISRPTKTPSGAGQMWVRRFEGRPAGRGQGVRQTTAPSWRRGPDRRRGRERAGREDEDSDDHADAGRPDRHAYRDPHPGESHADADSRAGRRAGKGSRGNHLEPRRLELHDPDEGRARHRPDQRRDAVPPRRRFQELRGSEDRSEGRSQRPAPAGPVHSRLPGEHRGPRPGRCPSAPRSPRPPGFYFQASIERTSNSPSPALTSSPGLAPRSASANSDW